jgi:hypothetical protein
MWNFLIHHTFQLILPIVPLMRLGALFQGISTRSEVFSYGKLTYATVLHLSLCNLACFEKRKRKTYLTQVLRLVSTVQVGSAQTSRDLKRRRCCLDTVKSLARFNSPLKQMQAMGTLFTPVPDIIDSDHESYAAHVSSQPTSLVVVASTIR